MEGSQPYYCSHVNGSLFLISDQYARVECNIGRSKPTKFLRNEGNVHLHSVHELSPRGANYVLTYSIGRNQRVNDRLPKLPAKNVKASHCHGSNVSTTVTHQGINIVHTLMGSERVNMVTRGM